MSDAQAFGKIFEGNAASHYTWKPGEYNSIDRGITDEDITRHLRGEEPGLLSIPIMASGLCHFAAGDCDRHAEADEPIDYVAVAQRITELGLPLIITRSKSPKSAHIWIFFKDVDGFDCAIARRLIEKYMKLLSIDGQIEIFPKQEKLKQDEQTGEWQKGSGINLPYFLDARIAFGRDGEELDLEGFIKLVRARQAFGQVLAQRDLSGNPEQSESTNEKDRPLPIAAIRRIHEKYLKDLLASNQLGHWNDTINETAYFAGRAFAAKALEDSELEIKNAIRKAAKATSGQNERQMEATLDSGWESGIAKPLEILDTEKAHADALDWSAWVFDENAVVPDRNVSYDNFALLTPEEFEPFIKMAAKRLGVRASSLEGSVKQRRVKEKAEGKTSGTVMVIADVEPWPEPVNLSQMLDEIVQVLRDYIVFQNNHDAHTLSLWSVFTYVADQFNIATLVGVSAMSRGCGKTSLMRMLLYLVRKGKGSVSLTLAVAFRVINDYHPTIIADEVDKWLRDNPELLTIFLAGHEREFAKVGLCKVINDVQVAVEYDCFSPKCWGQINLPDDQLVSRSLVITLRSKKPEEKVKTWPKVGMPAEVGDVFIRLQRQARRWAIDNVEAIRNTQPDVGTLDNRLQDNWYPLLVIANLASDEWKARALAAAGVEAISEPGEEIVLLRDIQNIFFTRKIDRISSAMLLGDLLVQLDSPWPKYKNQKDGLSQHQLSKMLRAMQIKSGNVRLAKQGELLEEKKGYQAKGYKRDQFQDLFDRQLVDDVPEEVPLPLPTRES